MCAYQHERSVTCKQLQTQPPHHEVCTGLQATALSVCLSVCLFVADRAWEKLVWKLLNQSTWKFWTMLWPWKSINGCNVLTSSQIHHGARSLVWKSHSKKWSGCDEIWYIKSDSYSGQMIWPKFKFLNSRWRSDGILKISFLAITRQWIDWFSRILYENDDGRKFSKFGNLE